MIEFLKNIKSKIGIYHLEDDAISIGKILKISGKYLFLDSYDSNNKKEGIKVFLISEIKRVILKSDYIEKLENKKNYIESFSFLKDNKINSFNDVCQKIIEKKCIVTLKLKNDDIEKGYLTKKIEKYYYFEILNDELKIISTEIFDEHYIEEIQIDTNDKINKNVPLNIIKLYSNNIYIGNILFDRKEIIIFKEIVEFSEDSRILILKKEDIEEISELYKEENIRYNSINKYIQNIKDITLLFLLEICLNFKFIIFIDNKKFSETKVGIIEKILNNRILELNTLNENYHFIEKIRIEISEIEILRIKNYSLFE
ncbi:phage head-tail adapter protein [Leptotrichia sp. oral taxon 221]|uniref:phage head-tail adapter protein n=1 Tax=Leptotrichia sp. oral taxon 221 TaxID=712362 RepID=UPI001B8BF31E|nr:phage head-tail adapter protein [Leptotrichia sp. oral taxon 221]QUB97928.1 phage head-tail adapter protein [Leptotrichia sp. oral taxon 221]